MNLTLKKILFLFILFFSLKQYGQNTSTIDATLNVEQKTIAVIQKIEFLNESTKPISTLVLNDWNNAYSSKTSALAKRFSDEFYRGFQLAPEKERGNTTDLVITDVNNLNLTWQRQQNNVDLVEINLSEKLAPNQKIILHLTYIVKIPNDKFTRYGYSEKGDFNLKNWFLTPARHENNQFVKYNNLNLDDIANAICDFEVAFKILISPLKPTIYNLISDLNQENKVSNENHLIYKLNGKNRTDFSVFLEPKNSFESFKNKNVEVLTNLKSNKVNEIEKAIAIDRIVNFINDNIGVSNNQKITVSQDDYDRNPFFGLNQIPSFLSPYPNSMLFEIKFLKTYLNNYLKNNLKLDPRKDNWIYDGIQVYTMIKYMDEFYPKFKLMGKFSKFKLLKGFHLFNIDFNEQYSYFYLIMARKNIDQSLSSSKDSLIKFNEQIANKYHAGLSLIYLDNYLENNSLSKSIKEFNLQNSLKFTNSSDFEKLLKSNTSKKIDWFFENIVNSRKIIDYRFSGVKKTKDSISFSLKNKSDSFVPVPIYGFKNDSIVFKKWFEPSKNDSVFKLKTNQVDKLIINFKNELPEYNLRNNSKKLVGFWPNNKPLKFAFLNDLENPNFNQIIYTPIATFNVYDGIAAGVRLENKAILNRPFSYDVNPTFSTKTQSLSGYVNFAFNKDYTDRNLLRVRYNFGTSFFHYAPDATYLKINPSIALQFRNEDYRDNKRKQILVRQVLINREKTAYIVDSSPQNYSVFNLRFNNYKNELTKQMGFSADVQFSEKFGKISSDFQFRRLYDDNRLFSFRIYAGAFTYNKSSTDFFSFALDRPTDYLFDYSYLGRSTGTGFASQEFILAEGGFKSKLNPAFANQWISTLNTSFSIWNWVEAYGDLGFVKNKNQKENFLFDSGIRLNLLPDYFELYFPVYSSNGWEAKDYNYSSKIRFVITLTPGKFTSLFTRKWF